MHYMSIDWWPAAIAIAVALASASAVRIASAIGRRQAILRTRRAIESVLNDDADA